MILAPAILVLAWSPSLSLERPLTMEIRGAPISAVLPVLSKWANIPFYDSPQTRDDVILIKVKDVTLEGLMARIAQAINGTWQKEGEGYRLVRTQGQQSAEAQEEKIWAANQIKMAMQQSAERLTKSKPWTRENAEAIAGRMATLLKTFNPDNRNSQFYGQFEKLSQDVPTRRTVDRIVATLDPMDLASIPPQIRVVYSTSPTPSQQRLSQKTFTILEQHMRDMELWTTAKIAKNVRPPEINGTTYYFSGMEMSETQSGSRPSRAILAVTRHTIEPNFQLELILVDGAGKVVSRANSNLSYTPPPPKDEPPTEGEPKISLAGEDLLIAKFWRDPSAQPLPDAMRQALLRPEVNEPLAIGNGSLFFQIAEAKKKNLVVSLTDRSALNFIGDKPTPVSAFMNRIRNTGAKVEDEGIWMVVSPSHPYLGRQQRCDRKVLGEYLRRAATGKGMSLEERAKFALSLPASNVNSLPYMLERVALGERSTEHVDERILKLFGTLSPEQMRAAKGGGLPFGSLRDNQLVFLRQLIYAPYPEIQYSPAPGKNVDYTRWNSFYNSLEREPTESLPNGPSGSAVLKIGETSEAVAATLPRKRQNWTEPPRYFGPEEYAMHAFQQSRSDLFPWMDSPDQRLNLEELRFGTRRRLSFTFQLTDELVINQQLNQNEVTQANPTSLSGLPEDFRKRANAMLEQQRKQYENVRPGQFGPPRSVNIPP